MVGLVYTQSELITQQVFLVESLSALARGMQEEVVEEAALKKSLKKGAILRTDQVGLNEQSMQHMKAIVFVQPNSVTLEALQVLLKSPRYKEYHVCK
jgi:hypothetical protein